MNQAKKVWLNVRQKVTRNTQLVSYGVAFLAVALVLGINLRLESLLRSTSTPLFLVAVMVSGWYGGIGTGLLATLLSLLAISYFFISPLSFMNLENLGTVGQLAVFTMSALLISGLNESRWRAIRREQALRTTCEVAQSEVRTAKERLQMALVGAKQGIWDWDLNRQVLTWDEHCKEIFGLPPDFAVTYEWHLKALHPDDRQRIREATAIALCNHTEFNQEYRTFHPNHTMRWILAQGRGFYDAAGEPYRMVGTVRDITDRKQAQETLQQREAELRLVTNTVPALISFIDSDQRYQFNNQTYATWFGNPAIENNGRHIREVLGEAAYQRIRPYIEQVLAGKTVTFESQVPYKVGGTRYVSATYVPQLNIRGDIEGFVALVNDISDRQKADERLNLLYETTRDLLATEQPMQLMSNLFSKLSEQLDLHYYYNYMVEEKDNRSMLHLRNYQGITDEVAASIEWIEFGQYLCGLVAQECRQIALDQTQISTHPNAQLACTAGITAYAGQPLIIKGRLLGTFTFASCTRTGFTPEELDLLGATCEQLAVSLERANLIASIQQQAEQLQEANRIKDEFLAVLSHELRSPLNPILGWSNLLRRGQLDAQQTDHALKVIERNAQMQAQLINDLLDVSSILQGKLSLNAVSVNLVSTIQAAIETVHLAAMAKSIQIDTPFDPSVGAIWGDAGRLQQVIWNLLSNAVKFTPAGGRVKIELNQLDSQAQLRISDTGKGINPTFLPYVFDRFYQEDNATTRHFGGLGLGLAITRYLVELHGGTVQVDSLGEGQGATFTVNLPLMSHQLPTASEAKSSQIPLDLNRIRILVVDDEEHSREFTEFLLEMHGASVTAVDSAKAALAVWIPFQPEILVCDIGMPEMDGYMLMRHVRALKPEQGGQIPAIALTALAGERDYQQAISAGFQTHISKPVEPDTLIEAIVGLVEILP